MKSLNKVNKLINLIDEYFEKDKNKQPCNKEGCSISITYKELKAIRENLEVLNILIKHLVLIPTGTNKEQLFIATDITNYLSEKDKEYFNKVKQWLLTNKEGDSNA